MSVINLSDDDFTYLNGNLVIKNNSPVIVLINSSKKIYNELIQPVMVCLIPFRFVTLCRSKMKKLPTGILIFLGNSLFNTIPISNNIPQGGFIENSIKTSLKHICINYKITRSFLNMDKYSISKREIIWK
jgi:hypothetical protein